MLGADSSTSGALAPNLNLHVVAEGVDDQRCWDRLRAVECDIAQGYFLSRPIPARNLEAWLGERATLPAALPVNSATA